MAVKIHEKTWNSRTATFVRTNVIFMQMTFMGNGVPGFQKGKCVLQNAITGREEE